MAADQQPTITTTRLVLRPFTQDDAPEVHHLAGNRAIAATTLNIPYPYEEGVAEAWIGTHREKFENREGATFAVTLRESATLIGAIGIVIKEHDRGEMGYWLGQPYWNQGYMTEAARAIIAFGFSELSLNKITASHIVGNPASGRVMEKAGMKYEGCSPQHVKKWGRYEDLIFYGILNDDFAKQHP
ncbi:MAG: GNAT family N-acetyltransferase [Candidatus Promineifilaceae bacterium]